jgi:hypothetical protein
MGVDFGFFRADRPCVFGVEAALLRLAYAEWKEVLYGLRVDEWEVVGYLLLTSGG